MEYICGPHEYGGSAELAARVSRQTPVLPPQLKEKT
jgi:hypothetical protein